MLLPLFELVFELVRNFYRLILGIGGLGFGRYLNHPFFISILCGWFHNNITNSVI